MDKLVHYYAYYEWLNIIPEKLSRTLAYLINLDGWIDCERLEDAPSYFNANQADIARAVGVTRQTVKNYLDELKKYKLIDYMTDRPGKHYFKETYVCLFNENIEQLRIIYHFREEYPDELFKYVKKLNIPISSKKDMYVKKFYIHMLRNYTYLCKEIIHSYVKFHDLYNNNNNTNNDKEISHGVTLEPNKNIIYSDSENATYKSVTAPRAWFRACRDKWGEELTVKKVDLLDKYLNKYPEQRRWILGRDLDAFINGLNEAYRVLNYAEKERPVEV